MTEEKYRKILDGVMEQAEKDFGEDINVPNKIELSDEEIVKALYICTTADDDMDCIDDCPMYEEDYCTTKLLKMAFDFIHRLQDENAKQKAEIERKNFALLEAKTNMTAYGTACVKSGYEKAVKDTTKEILCELLDIEVKDEDYKMFFLDVCDKLEKFAQKYGVEVE